MGLNFTENILKNIQSVIILYMIMSSQMGLDEWHPNKFNSKGVYSVVPGWAYSYNIPVP